MKNRNSLKSIGGICLVTLISLSMLFYLGSCQKKSDNNSSSVRAIKALYTNGTMVPISQTTVKGTLFVMDDKGNPINGITASNIHAKLIWATPKNSKGDSTSVGGLVIIHPNNQKNVGIAAAVTMDYSGSMYTDYATIPNLELGVQTFIHSMKKSDIGEIIKFDENVIVAQAFTGDTSALASAVRQYYSLEGNTALFQSIYQGLQDASPLDTSKYLRSVVAFTDGGENASSISEADMLAYAISAGIPIHTIGFLTEDTDTTLLKDIAQRSGGFYFFTSNSSDFSKIYALISSQLTNSYAYIVNWQGTLPASGTNVNASVTTTYQGFTSTFQYTYVMP
jgi:hypothetical protein